MAGLALKAEDIHIRDEDWTLVEVTPDYRRYTAVYAQGPKGPVYVQKTEHLAGDALLEQNARERNDTDGARWSDGMGSDKGGNMPLVKVASIPLNKFYADVAPYLGEADDFLRWYLNQDENQPFKTRRGTW